MGDNLLSYLKMSRSCCNIYSGTSWTFYKCSFVLQQGYCRPRKSWAPSNAVLKFPVCPSGRKLKFVFDDLSQFSFQPFMFYVDALIVVLPFILSDMFAHRCAHLHFNKRVDKANVTLYSAKLLQLCGHYTSQGSLIAWWILRNAQREP